jgi:Protein CHAPERONE-LIKE PROTEIN OF POR1-like
MSELSPYEQLGVTEESSFEEIQEAKQRLMQQHQDDNKLLEKIETAYDAVIMDRLRLRQEGKIKVPERIRFPERGLEAPNPIKPLSIERSPSWLQKIIDTPSAQDIGLSTGVFGLSAVITLIVNDRGGSMLSLLLALGVFANIYFLNRKERKFGRAVLITLFGLLLGIGLGAGMASGLKAAGITLPISDQQFLALVTFFLLWIISSFVR